jgi:hypothetical protein
MDFTRLDRYLQSVDDDTTHAIPLYSALTRGGYYDPSRGVHIRILHAMCDHAPHINAKEEIRRIVMPTVFVGDRWGVFVAESDTVGDRWVLRLATKEGLPPGSLVERHVHAIKFGFSKMIKKHGGSCSSVSERPPYYEIDLDTGAPDDMVAVERYIRGLPHV